MRYILCQMYSVSNGSSPSTISRSPQAVVWEKGPSMAPLTARGAESTSPSPVMPASVCTLTSRASCPLSQSSFTLGIRR